MKNSYWAAAGLAAVLCAYSSARVHAQAPAQPRPRPAAGAPAAAPTPGPVTVVDMSYIFKHYQRFLDLTADMQRDVEAAETQLKQRRDALRALVQQLEMYDKGSPDFRQLEEQIAKENADLQLQVNLQKKEFLEREARIFYDTYTAVTDEIRLYAESAGIKLVLRFNGDPIDRENPPEVLKELNKSIVYYSPTIDITPVILDRLAQRGPQPTPQQGPAPEVGQGDRPGVPRQRQ